MYIVEMVTQNAREQVRLFFKRTATGGGHNGFWGIQPGLPRNPMSVHLPLDVAAAMEALGIPGALVNKFIAATERLSALSLEAVGEHMAGVGLSLRQRRAVKRWLQDANVTPSSDAVSAYI